MLIAIARWTGRLSWMKVVRLVGTSMSPSGSATWLTREKWGRLRLMLHDQSGAALMRLAAEGIALHDAPLAPPPYERGADGACSPAALTGTLSTFKGRGTRLSRSKW